MLGANKPAVPKKFTDILGTVPVPPEKFYAPQPAAPIPQAMPPPPPPVAPAPASMPAPPVPQAPKLSRKSREEVASQHASISRTLSRCLRAPIAKMCSSDLHLQQKIPNVSMQTARCIRPRLACLRCCDPKCVRHSAGACSTTGPQRATANRTTSNGRRTASSWCPSCVHSRPSRTSEAGAV